MNPTSTPRHQPRRQRHPSSASSIVPATVEERVLDYLTGLASIGVGVNLKGVQTLLSTQTQKHVSLATAEEILRRHDWFPTQRDSLTIWTHSDFHGLKAYASRPGRKPLLSADQETEVMAELQSRAGWGGGVTVTEVCELVFQWIGDRPTNSIARGLLRRHGWKTRGATSNTVWVKD